MSLYHVLLMYLLCKQKYFLIKTVVEHIYYCKSSKLPSMIQIPLNNIWVKYILHSSELCCHVIKAMGDNKIYVQQRTMEEKTPVVIQCTNPFVNKELINWKDDLFLLLKK